LIKNEQYLCTSDGVLSRRLLAVFLIGFLTVFLFIVNIRLPVVFSGDFAYKKHDLRPYLGSVFGSFLFSTFFFQGSDLAQNGLPPFLFGGLSDFIRPVFIFGPLLIPGVRAARIWLDTLRKTHLPGK
jgi:hypothetical protein